MKFKKMTLFLIICSLISFISNIVLVGFDFELNSFSSELRIPEIKLMMSHYIYSVEELLHTLASLAIFISIFFIFKTIIPLLCSFCLIFFAEVLRFIGIVIHYNEFRNYIYDYNFYMVIYNLLAILVLTIISILLIKKKISFKLLIKCSTIITILYVILYLEPVIFVDSYINISLVLYYVSTYTLFGLFGVFWKHKCLNVNINNDSVN